MGVPVEPAPCRWDLPDPADADGAGVAGVGADLEPGTLLAAYRRGLFPMHVGPPGPGRGKLLGWWSPDPRGILPLDRLRVSRSLRRSMRRFHLTVDEDFAAVVAACAEPNRPHGWIDGDIVAAYVRLHELGWAHSVEARSSDDGSLVGGLYGVGIGGLFAGESMFHRRPDASKVALVHLVELLGDDLGARLLDVQWTTDHLATLGAVDIPREEYLTRLAAAIESPPPVAFS